MALTFSGKISLSCSFHLRAMNLLMIPYFSCIYLSLRSSPSRICPSLLSRHSSWFRNSSLTFSLVAESSLSRFSRLSFSVSSWFLYSRALEEWDQLQQSPVVQQKDMRRATRLIGASEPVTDLDRADCLARGEPEYKSEVFLGMASQSFLIDVDPNCTCQQFLLKGGLNYFQYYSHRPCRFASIRFTLWSKICLSMLQRYIYCTNYIFLHPRELFACYSCLILLSNYYFYCAQATVSAQVSFSLPLPAAMAKSPRRLVEVALRSSPALSLWPCPLSFCAYSGKVLAGRSCR